MQWLDVAGAPGVGKSTICDPLWGPHDIPIENIDPPIEWHDFMNEITRLLGVIQDHPTLVAAVRMNRRSVRKMAKVSRVKPSTNGDGPPFYIQTGFIQRGLGFGWRLLDMGYSIEETTHFWRLMPTSLGSIFLEAPPDVIKERNKEREKHKATAHENRTFMVDYMLEAASYAEEQLRQRGVNCVTYSTEGSADELRKRIVKDFAPDGPRNTEAAGYHRQEPIFSPVCRPPVWW